MAEARKKYTKEFKLEAVRRLDAGKKPAHQIEEELGISSGHFLKTPEMIYQFMKDNRGIHCVEKIAGMFQVSRSRFYAWTKRPVS